MTASDDENDDYFKEFRQLLLGIGLFNAGFYAFFFVLFCVISLFQRHGFNGIFATYDSFKQFVTWPLLWSSIIEIMFLIVLLVLSIIGEEVLKDFAALIPWLQDSDSAGKTHKVSEPLGHLYLFRLGTGLPFFIAVTALYLTLNCSQDLGEVFELGAGGTPPLSDADILMFVIIQFIDSITFGIPSIMHWLPRIDNVPSNVLFSALVWVTHVYIELAIISGPIDFIKSWSTRGIDLS